MKKKNIYMIIAAVVIILAIVGIAQIDRGPSEVSESGEDIASCGEGTIIYVNEDLCWQRSVGPEEVANWQAADDYCEDLELAGKADWHLPTVDELSSIVDESNNEIVINTEYFQDTTPAHYWTSSEYKEGFHWYIHFSLGYQGFAQNFREDYGVRCVREKTLF